jgi:KipI family sensor histidine kinase inhibitor
MEVFADIVDIGIAGVDGLIIYFDGSDLAKANDSVLTWQARLSQGQFHWLQDLVPSYNSLLILYDLHSLDSHSLYQTLKRLADVDINTTTQGQHHDIPVWYNPPQLSDVTSIARYHNLTPQEVIQYHSQGRYRVYAVGFAPGFAYMGELDGAISTPRLAEPRMRVPKGAVAIADRQTAIYPSESPGGWNILGLCPLPLFDVEQQPPARFATGDTVAFYSISAQEYEHIKASYIKEGKHVFPCR